MRSTLSMGNSDLVEFRCCCLLRAAFSPHPWSILELLYPPSSDFLWLPQLRLISVAILIRAKPQKADILGTRVQMGLVCRVIYIYTYIHINLYIYISIYLFMYLSRLWRPLRVHVWVLGPFGVGRLGHETVLGAYELKVPGPRTL